MRIFLYTDDLEIAVQGDNFEEIEKTIKELLMTLTEYYERNYFKINPHKTQMSTYHLRNREASRKLNIDCKDLKWTIWISLNT